MTFRRISGTYLFVSVAALFLSAATNVAWSSSDAKTCYVDKIKYKNKGGYSVGEGIDLYFIKKNGSEKHSYSGAYYPSLSGGKDGIETGESLSVDLNKFNGKEDDFGDASLKDGDEVWIKVGITLGNTVTCRKDGHKLVYKKNVNKTMTFKTSGTTLNNNRCKYDGDMGDDCYSGD